MGICNLSNPCRRRHEFVVCIDVINQVRCHKSPWLACVSDNNYIFFLWYKRNPTIVVVFRVLCHIPGEALLLNHAIPRLSTAYACIGQNRHCLFLLSMLWQCAYRMHVQTFLDKSDFSREMNRSMAVYLKDFENWGGKMCKKCVRNRMTFFHICDIV